MHFKELWTIHNPARPISLPQLFSIRNISIAGIIAAVYVALTLINPWSFGGVQFRVSEALTVLPILLPQSIPGLFVGVLISNLFSPAGILDVIFGSLATLLAALISYGCRRTVWVAMLSPVLVNGLIVGLLLHFVEHLPLLPTMASVAFGELVVVFLLGMLLLKSLDRIDLQNR